MTHCRDDHWSSAGYNANISNPCVVEGALALPHGAHINFDGSPRAGSPTKKDEGVPLPSIAEVPSSLIAFLLSKLLYQIHFFMSI
jgi:hypothetical protein